MPVRSVASAVAGWINRLGAIWIEGQVAQLKSRAGAPIVWITLRDPVAEVSLQITAHHRVFDIVDPPVVEGAKVVVFAKAEYYAARGSLSFQAREIRPVGVGELLARLERLKRLLAAEGLFAAERKLRLPFLPHVVGLVCGRDSAAEDDVLTNARLRWPAVRFEVRNVPVQGPQAAAQVLGALRNLDADPAVEVIVLARGGGSLEDLLPFSDEALVRAVAECRTPVVSAIGHETDSPLLDLVADLRASTPTDAARRIVPDMAEELAGLAGARDRLRTAISGRIAAEQAALTSLRARPVLADPHSTLRRHAEELGQVVDRARTTMRHRLERAGDDVAHQRARVRGLSPLATLERGYAVVQDPDGVAVRAAADVEPGQTLGVRVANGRFTVEVTEGDHP